MLVNARKFNVLGRSANQRWIAERSTIIWTLNVWALLNQLRLEFLLRAKELEFRAIQTWVGNAAGAISESDISGTEPSGGVACIASSGTPAVILKTTDGGLSWREVDRDETESRPTAAYSLDHGRTWHDSPQPPGGHRSCVVALPACLRLPVADSQESTEASDETPEAARDPDDPQPQPGCTARRFLAVGPTGTEYSATGCHWSRLNDQGFHVAFAVNGQVYAAGSHGRFARLQIE